LRTASASISYSSALVLFGLSVDFHEIVYWVIQTASVGFMPLARASANETCQRHLRYAAQNANHSDLRVMVSSSVIRLAICQ